MGSLALGDFDPASSDVDILVVTESPVSEAQFAALEALHERVPRLVNEFGQEYEVFYVERAVIRRWQSGQQHLRAEPYADFHWETHRANFVIERWVLREHGVALCGPDPKTLIDPVSPDQLREAARREILIRLDDWAGGQPMPDWLGMRGSQAFEAETMCRALYTIETGGLCSKREAAAWALETLPAKWRSLLEWSQRHKKDETRDTARLDETIAFVRWAAGRASMSPDEHRSP